MKAKSINEGVQKMFALVFEKGGEFIGELNDFVQKNRLAGGHFTAASLCRACAPLWAISISRCRVL